MLFQSFTTYKQPTMPIKSMGLTCSVSGGGKHDDDDDDAEKGNTIK